MSDLRLLLCVIICTIVGTGSGVRAGGDGKTGFSRNLELLGAAGGVRTGTIPSGIAVNGSDDAVPEEYSQLEGRPKSSFQFQWDGADCTLDIPLSNGRAKTKFKGQMTDPIRSDLTPVETKESHPLYGQLELSFPEKCPSDFAGLLAIMQQGRFSATSEEVGVVHPSIAMHTVKEGPESLDVELTGIKVHFETTMPLQLFRGQFGVAFKIKMVEGNMLAKNSTFRYSTSLVGLSSNGASSGEVRQEEGDAILSVPALSYTFDTAQILGSTAPVRLLLTFTSDITAEFLLEALKPAVLNQAGGIGGQGVIPGSQAFDGAEGNITHPLAVEEEIIVGSVRRGKTKATGHVHRFTPDFDRKMLVALLILCSPVLLSFFLSMGMSVNAMIYLWEEKALRVMDAKDSGSVSSIPDDEVRDSIDIGLGVVGEEMIWSTSDFNTMLGTRQARHESELLDTDFTTTITFSQIDTKEPSQAEKSSPRTALESTGPSLRNFLNESGNKGLIFEGLFCSLPVKGVFGQRRWLKHKQPSGWSVLDKLSKVRMNKCEHKIILHHMSGSLQFGELTAVIGPEEAGKTTLLRLISGKLNELPRRAAVRGSVVVKKFPGSAAKDFTMAWLSEDSHLFYALTVEEILIKSAVLSNARTGVQDTEALKKHVANIVQMMDLRSILGKSVVGKGSVLSQMQKRKISIAQELATVPDGLILDEPDVGLDSRDTMEIMGCCRKIAKSGLMVLLATREPSSTAFDMFDRVFLLSRGRAVYSGLAKELAGFFVNVGFPCPLEISVPQHATKVVTKPTSLVRVLASRRNPMRIEESENLLVWLAKRKTSHVKRGGTIELGTWGHPSAEPSDSPVAAHPVDSSGGSPQCDEESGEPLVKSEESNVGVYTGTRSRPINAAKSPFSGNGDSMPVVSRTPPGTPGRMALETAILENSVGQVSMPVSGRSRNGSRVWRNSGTLPDFDYGALRGDQRMEFMNTAGSEFGDSVLEFDILSNPPTWRSNAEKLWRGHTTDNSGSFTQSAKGNSGGNLTERSALLYRRSVNPFDSDSDGDDRNNGGTGYGGELQKVGSGKRPISRTSPVPSSIISPSPSESWPRSPYGDDDDSYFEESRTPGMTMTRKWPADINQQGNASKADSEGDSSRGSLAFDTRSRFQVTVKESKIPRVTNQPSDRPILVQPGASKIAKPLTASGCGIVSDSRLPQCNAGNHGSSQSVPALNIARVPSLNLKALEQPQKPCAENKAEGLVGAETPPRTGRSSTATGIITPVSRRGLSHESLPSHRDQPFRIQPGTGVVTSPEPFDIFPMDWQARNPYPSHQHSRQPSGQRSISGIDIASEGTPEKIGNLDTSRSIAAYAQEVAAYARQNVRRKETEMSMDALSPGRPVRKEKYENSIRELPRVPFRLELASVFVMAARDIARRRCLLPLHLIISAVLGLSMGVLFFEIQDDTKGLSRRVMVFYALLCLLTGGALSLFFRMKKEIDLITYDTRHKRYRPGTILLVKACAENTFLRIAPVVIFTMVFLPLSGIQRGTVRFLLFVSGLSMFWMTFAAIMYLILVIMPIPVGKYLMTFQLSVHGPLICGFLIPRFRPWVVLRVAALFSAFCNVFEILTLSELSWKTGEVRDGDATPPRTVHKHAYPSKMGLREARMVQDAAVLVGVYVFILGVFWLTLTVRSRWGSQRRLKSS